VRCTIPPEKTLLLIYNAMWGTLPSYETLQLPAGCEITTQRERFAEAEAVIFHIPDLGRIHHLEKRPGQLWVAWSMECETLYPRLREPAFIQQFDLSMTYRLDSDVPTPYYQPGLLQELKTLAQPKPPGNLVALFVSSRFNHSHRLEYLQELMEHLEVHSFGKLFNNRRIGGDMGRQTKLEISAGYAFSLAFENSIATDYVSEKFFDPLVAGSVPVYLGAPNIDQFAPGEHCYINAADFKPAELAKYLKALSKDEAGYLGYLTWKELPLRESFIQMVAKVSEPAFVRLCQTVQKRQFNHLDTRS
jgi:hypothetical protein